MRHVHVNDWHVNDEIYYAYDLQSQEMSKAKQPISNMDLESLSTRMATTQVIS